MIKTIKYTNNYWFLLFLVLFSGGGISLLNRNVYSFATIILSGVSLFWMIKNRISFSGFIRLIVPWFVYCLISFVYFETVHPLFFVLLPISFFSAYVLINSNIDLKIIFINYEKIVSTLAKISLFFFAWQIINSPSLISLFSIIDFSNGENYNAIVYTIHHRSISDGFNRNSGFCWEPGPFACFLVIALIVHFLKNRFILDKSVLLYIITIGSTFSTTGYLCLFIIFIWYSYVKSKKYFLFVFPVVIFILTIIFFNNNALNNKILPQIESASNKMEFYSENGKDQQTSIGRFDGFLLNIKDFKSNPILGYGGHFAATFSQKNDLKISSTSGLGNWLAQYGSIGFVFLIVSFFRSSYLFVELFKTKGFLFIFLVYLVITFSFNIIDRPFFIFLFFIGIIKGKKNINI